uniref:EF-hand domain-containing protein n=1 Tax=Prymnesium polylepis TaxID=72548 RepID=A0A7S4M4R4_9EUKA
MLGSMPLLVRAGTKSMSLTFLHRLISTLTFAKLCHNQTKMPNGQAPLPMPEFVAFQTLSMYGVRKMAQTYVEQMCKGLSIHRRELPRLQLFASALGLFVEDLLPDESYSVVLEALGNVLHTLENDRGLTGFTNPRLFWQPYAHQHEDVWLPVSYVRPAIDAALASEPSASTREELRSAMGEFIEAHQQPNAAACAQLSAARSKNKHHRKACILGEKVPCGFVSADTVLLELSIRHASAVQHRSRKMLRLLARQDEKRNGKMSRVELAVLLQKLGLQVDASHVDELHSRCITLGDGELFHEDLERVLVRFGQLQRSGELQAAKAKGPGSDAADGELAELAHAWDAAVMEALGEASVAHTAESQGSTGVAGFAAIAK